MRKTMSVKQLTANRRNAQKSTGPKTHNGRAVSKMNALKHGILSKEVLVRGKHARENAHELRKLHARFREHLNPVGPVEEMLVDQIVTAHWRLRRAMKAESGEIALGVDNGYWERKRNNDKFTVSLWELDENPETAMRNSSFGNFFMRRQLLAVRDSVEAEGELTEAAVQSVIFRGKPYGLTAKLEKLRQKSQANPDGLSAMALRLKQKEEVLAYLNGEINQNTWRESWNMEREEMEEEARQAAAALPSLVVLDKIMRYETKLERQQYRAMFQLERAQRLRLGETVPLPVAMVVSP
jgi:hypothetical protein